MKENLTSAIVLRSSWQPGTPLLDLMCGSGTPLIEAALIAADCAPGLTRPFWGFSAWSEHNEALWHETVREARERGWRKRRRAFTAPISTAGCWRRRAKTRAAPACLR